MGQSVTLSCGDRQVRVVSTESADGDFAVSLQGTRFVAPRRAIIDHQWTWLNQVHGSAVVIAEAPGHLAGSQADAVVTFTSGCPIAINTADCAPLVLTSTTGVAVVHVGWRGALSGVVQAAADELRANGGTPLQSWLGPCIGPGAYEFGSGDLDRVAAEFGDSVRGQTTAGTPALDMHQTVARACERAGWPAPGPSDCTSNPRYFSHRTRGDEGRHATVAWIL